MPFFGGSSYFDRYGQEIKTKAICGCCCYACLEDRHCKTRNKTQDCDQVWEDGDELD